MTGHEINRLEMLGKIGWAVVANGKVPRRGLATKNWTEGSMWDSQTNLDMCMMLSALGLLEKWDQKPHEKHLWVNLFIRNMADGGYKVMEKLMRLLLT